MKTIKSILSILQIRKEREIRKTFIQKATEGRTIGKGRRSIGA